MIKITKDLSKSADGSRIKVVTALPTLTLSDIGELRIFENSIYIWLGTEWKAFRISDTILDYGGNSADGSSDDAAIAACLAATSDVVFTAGTWNVNTSFTIPNTKRIRFMPGAILKIATGVTVTINGDIDAPNLRIFNVDTGTSSVIFGSRNRAREIPAIWFGITPDNGGVDTTRMTKWLASSTGKTLFTMTPGVYVTAGGHTLPTGCSIVGVGGDQQVQISINAASNDTFIFSIPDNAQDVSIKNLRLVNVRNVSGNTISGTSGIRVGTGIKRLRIIDNRFQDFHGYGIYFDDNTQHSEIENNTFDTIDNSPANFGVGSTPAVAIYSTKLLGNVTFAFNKIHNCDVAAKLMGESTAADEIVGLKWLYNSVENCGRSTLADAHIIHIEQALDITWVGGYVEANQTGASDSAVYIKNVQSFTILGGVYAAGIGGVEYSVTMFTFDSGFRGSIIGARFNSIATGGYFVRTLNGFAMVTLQDCSFDLGAPGAECSNADLASRLSGNITVTPKTKGSAGQYLKIGSDGFIQEWGA
jgi:hypothetical protein